MSDVFLHNRYGIQIADSFGEKLDRYSCGRDSWYRATLLLMPGPPAGHWQTFDITLKAPQFDEINGRQVRGRRSSSCS